MTTLRSLTVNDLFSELADFMGNDYPRNFRLAQTTNFPKLNIYSYNKNGTKKYVVEAALSGYSPQDVTVTVDRNKLIFSYEKSTNSTENEERDYYLNEIKQSSFSRSVLLSDKLDTQNPVTSYRDGVVRVEFTEDVSKAPKVLKFLE